MRINAEGVYLFQTAIFTRYSLSTGEGSPAKRRRIAAATPFSEVPQGNFEDQQIGMGQPDFGAAADFTAEVRSSSRFAHTPSNL
jgi:hypothetical protein